MISNSITGEDALKKSGFPPSFITALQETMMDGSLKILRAGTIADYNSRTNPKSGENKSKTTAYGLGAAYLATKPKFTRVKNKKHLTIPEKDQHHLETGFQKAVTLSLTLREMLANKDVEIENYDPDTKNIVFRLTKEKQALMPADEVVRYHVDLSAGIPLDPPKTYLREWDKEFDSTRSTDKKFRRILLEEIKDHEDKKLDGESFEIKASINNSIPENYTVFASQAPKKHMRNVSWRPITGDIDGLLTTVPRVIAKNPHLNYVLKEYKTFNAHGEPIIEERESLRRDAIHWYNFRQQELRAKENKVKDHKKAPFLRKDAPSPLTKTEEKILEQTAFTTLCNKFFLDHAGCISPYEYVQNQIVNEAFDHINISSLFQHGDEARSPFPPQDLDAPFVIVLKTKEGNMPEPIFVHNAKELVEKLNSKTILRHYKIELSHKFPMDFFHPIIESQIALNLKDDIPAKTLECYHLYKELSSAKAPFSIEILKKAEIYASSEFYQRLAPELNVALKKYKVDEEVKTIKSPTVFFENIRALKAEKSKKPLSPKDKARKPSSPRSPHA